MARRDVRVQLVGKRTPPRRHRFARAEAAIKPFRNAPAVDYDRLRHDLDRIADQGTPQPA